jgi:uncharacterized LabA/DUF88 family protein
MFTDSSKIPENNYAFIDSQNLNLSIRDVGWKLDFRRFRIYLAEKYSVKKAFLFIGYIPGNHHLYSALQQAGYICIFKPTLIYARERKTKGNCDAELVLHSMIEYPNYHCAIIVTGDGDFHCLIHYLIEQRKLKKVLIPNQKKYSALLKRFDSGYLAFISDLQSKLAYKKRTPYGQNHRGRLSS